VRAPDSPRPPLRLPAAPQLAQSYLQSIRGVGIARANEQKHDKALWAADR
jgi:hypothetical protein